MLRFITNLSTEIVWNLSGDQITKSASYPTLMHPACKAKRNIKSVRPQMSHLYNDPALQAWLALDREACSSAAQSSLWPLPGSRTRTDLQTSKVMFGLMVKCLLTKLQRWDAAPGRHEVLLPRHLEVRSAGRVVRHDHVNIPRQHGLP